MEQNICKFYYSLSLLLRMGTGGNFAQIYKGAHAIHHHNTSVVEI